MSYENILVTVEGQVGIITLNRPEALNALNRQLTAELSEAAATFDADPAIGAIVITGSDRAFAAGADIKEIKDKTFAEVYEEQLITSTWEGLARVRKPTIAAVSGHAIGGGCEIAMMCDMIIASETARFALPETSIGIIPGAGGTQRLTRIVGKAVAMDMILSGRALSAAEAQSMGLVSRVVPAGTQVVEAVKLAAKVTAYSQPVVQLAKEAVNKAYETHLQEGIYVERRLLYSTFALDDRREGMNAFAEKRPPQFRNR
ncbi:enoyl-CoA hydratase [Ochrobactrum sp. P6BS-III]|uniref:enoyl-CoA hydratase-related protein n=1 Tax=unclassified Ochrobactrum TaxID=239106 RepID=UPI0009944DE5|nr:enoyl-CoA hydratase [Ochrobactrum sp. P6BSIII]OOL18131.1 enoyl-CoA hydratase [Ochrobactrum sp. P6BS-III]